jgi:beta-carotene hydroxylase
MPSVSADLKISISLGSESTHRERSPNTLPPLASLGNDLLLTSRHQRWLALGRPFAGVLLYAGAVQLGLWWMTPIVVFLIFITVVTVTHDVVHGALGLNERDTELALFFMGAVLFESGHAYRRSHLQHHRVFPGPDDPEGDPARMTWWRAVLHGPVMLPKLWWWAYRRSTPGQRAWLLAEVCWPALFAGVSVALWSFTPALSWYLLLAVCGSWVYPLLTAHLPHRNYGPTPLAQTHTLRGHLIPRLFLELTYHLEHHLYPGVPSHHLPELSGRLTPFFEQAGVRPWRVW